MSAPAMTANTAPPSKPNKKKAKRRAKAAEKAAQEPLPSAHEAMLGLPDEEEEDFSGDDDGHESHRYPGLPNGHLRHDGHAHAPPRDDRSKPNRKKSMPVGRHHGAYDAASSKLPPMQYAPPQSRSGALRSTPSATGHHHSGMNMNIWNTSSQQERQNIKDFWLSLSEDDRKALLKIEKEAVLKKMKQQQKHSCSCTVCGRKRTAIEEELEVLYEGYYEELEQYAHHDQPPLPNSDGLMPDPLQRRPHPLATPPPLLPQIHKTSHVREHLEEEELSDEEDEDDEEEEEYSDEEDEEEDYSDDEPEQELEPPRGHPGVPDFFNFGSHLTVKDNLLTVADDLLKNDGRKFIEMMEQLAERRMNREIHSQHEAENHSGYPPDDPAYGHEDPLAAGEEYDDEASYDSQEDFDDDMDEEDETGTLTDEQRMQEGRRMFQIFAARMFEQRVLNAYREKVAAERQRKLLEELEDESKQQEQREAKRQRDAQKKKDKKKQQQQAKAEEKARKDAEKAEEEARLKAAEEKRLEEQRRKKEEQRKKREDEKRKQEDEKARKEAEKLRRQQEEQQRREDAERKAREQKAAEKARKDEARKRERNEREARDREAKERKAQEDRERKEREAKSKAEREAREREKPVQPLQHLTHPQIAKRPSQAGMVAIPGVYPKQPQSGLSSPHPSIATPALPKAQNPAKHRQPSQQGSHASSPKQPQSQMSNAPSKSSSPASVGHQQPQVQPKTIMQKVGNQHNNHLMQNPPPTSSPLPHHHFQPPPGMPHLQQHPGAFGNMPPMGFQGFPGPQGPMMPMGRQMPMFPHQGPPMGMQNRMPFGNGMPGTNGMHGMGHPGMMMPQGRGFPFDAPGAQAPPGFGQHNHAIPQQTSLIGPPLQATSGDQRPNLPGHSRQQSHDKDRFESTTNQPIARPAPIARPSSVKPQAGRQGPASEVDELSNHLGSSALLDDSDEPMPQNQADVRRHSNIAPTARNVSIPGGFGPPMGGGFGNPSSTWNTPHMGMNAPFGQSPGISQAQPGWGSLPNPGMGSWMQQNNAAYASNNAAFANNAGFGASLGLGNGVGGHRPNGVGNRPLTIRIALCQACKQLNNASRGEGDGYHSVKALLSQIAANRPPLDSPPTLREIEEICETEGDSQNGGGELYVRRNGATTPEGSTSPSGEQSSPGGGFAVKWEPAAEASTPDTSRGALKGLGEIGSPLPSKTSPAQGFGAPGSRVTPFGGMGGFQSLSAVNSFGN